MNTRIRNIVALLAVIIVGTVCIVTISSATQTPTIPDAGLINVLRSADTAAVFIAGVIVTLYYVWKYKTEKSTGGASAGEARILEKLERLVSVTTQTRDAIVAMKVTVDAYEHALEKHDERVDGFEENLRRANEKMIETTFRLDSKVDAIHGMLDRRRHDRQG